MHIILAMTERLARNIPSRSSTDSFKSGTESHRLQRYADTAASLAIVLRFICKVRTQRAVLFHCQPLRSALRLCVLRQQGRFAVAAGTCWTLPIGLFVKPRTPSRLELTLSLGREAAGKKSDQCVEPSAGWEKTLDDRDR